MTYAIESENHAEGQATGPYRQGGYATIEDAKAVARGLAAKPGFTELVIRDGGDLVSIGHGNIKSRWRDGQWYDEGGDRHGL